MKSVKIHFRDEEVEKLYNDAGFMTSGSVGYDLMLPDDTIFFPETINRVNFGVIVKPPEGYHTEIVSRSSTPVRYALEIPNAVGIVDADYCGEDDWLLGLFKFNPEQIYVKSEWSESAINLNEYTDLREQCGVTKATRFTDLYTNRTVLWLPKGTRLAQLLIRKSYKFDIINFTPSSESRGGVGSTGE